MKWKLTDEHKEFMLKIYRTDRTFWYNIMNAEQRSIIRSSMAMDSQGKYSVVWDSYNDEQRSLLNGIRNRYLAYMSSK